MNYWFFLNLFLFLYALGLVVFSSQVSVYGSAAVYFAIVGLVFILFNWNMHAIFSKIRSLESREEKIKVAKKARIIMPYHMWVGFISLAFILLHILFVFQTYGLTFIELKMISGIIAFGGLLFVVISGWMRRNKATGRRRRAHLYMAMSLFFLIAFHLISG